MFTVIVVAGVVVIISFLILIVWGAQALNSTRLASFRPVVTTRAISIPRPGDVFEFVTPRTRKLC